MNIASAYGVAGSYGYGAEKALSASKKVFRLGSEVPTQEPTGEKATTQTQESGNSATGIANTGSANLPRFGFIHTKTEPTRSDEEILKEIEALGKEHAKTGKFRNDDERFWELIDEYISSVSPDRRSILESGALDNGYGEQWGSSMSYNSGGMLMQALTQGETSREKEVFASYDVAYDLAGGSSGIEYRSEEFKELYNKAYDRLMSGSVV